MTKPTRQQILSDFKKWVSKGSDTQFQLNRVVRRWAACEYATQELPLLISATPEQWALAQQQVS